MNKPPISKNRWILQTALTWAALMSIVLCAILWKNGHLTIVIALGVILLATAAGFAFAMLLCESLNKRYRVFKDD
jgi:hypothetical protein